MTHHATIHYIDSTTLAVAFDYDATKKEAVAALTGAQWQKTTKRWLLPVARLGDVVKLFWPDVSIDYDVLCARDEQLRRMFRQYQACGVTFAVEAGRVTCDHYILNGWFLAHGNALHAQALQYVLNEAKATPRARNQAQRQAEMQAEDEALARWLKGVKNAAKNEDRKAAMIAAQKAKRFS